MLNLIEPVRQRLWLTVIRTADCLSNDTQWEVILNGIDVNSFNATVKNADPTPYSGLGFLTVGRYSSEKAQLDLIRAMSDVTDELPDVELRIVGYGPLEEKLNSAVKRRGLENHVTVTGYRETVDRDLAGADVFVLPSLAEGLPISLIEAMAAGLPVVATDIPGINELVVANETGILVPPRSPEELAAAMISMQDEHRRSTFGQNGFEHAARHFGIDDTAARHIQLYHHIGG